MAAGETRHWDGTKWSLVAYDEGVPMRVWNGSSWVYVRPSIYPSGYRAWRWTGSSWQIVEVELGP